MFYAWISRQHITQGIANSNRILAESLTQEVLIQHYIDAIDNSDTVYVVPEGSNPLVGIQ